MSKQILSYDALLERVQGVVSSYPQECQNIKVKDISVHSEEIDKANWHINWIGRAGSDANWPQCWQAIEKEIIELRKKYDVDPETK